MNIKNTYQNFTIKLQTIQSEAEANAIARIVFEDAFKLYDFTSEQEFSVENENRLEKIITRLLQNEPVQYILGEADFYGYKFKVNEHVLIPRQDTEELVFYVKNTIKSFVKKDAITLLDIGTGSGCIPITLKKIFPKTNIHALDVSEDALTIAKKNAENLQAEITFYHKSILEKEDWDSLPNFDIIVSNPPYIPHREAHLMPENVKQFEPHLALFIDDENPLIFYEMIADFAKQKLNNDGYLFFETNEFNAKEVLKMLRNKTFTSVVLEQDMEGKDRMIRAQL
ncbi:MAG: peptide chain release factor N(5)-glutamine methyltransferase [Saprospiraceae bacterium]